MPTRPEWVRLPTNWIRFERGLDRFAVRDLGTAITALKLYLAIAASHVERAISRELPRGTLLSYSELSGLADVSRGMIGPALRKLDRVVGISQGGGRRSNEYQLLGFPPKGGWAKLPADYLLTNGAIRQFEPRSKADLAALKLYLLLIALRDNETGTSQLSYDTAVKYMQTTRDGVSRGKSKLIDCGLITVRRAHEMGLNRSYPCRATMGAVEWQGGSLWPLMQIVSM